LGRLDGPTTADGVHSLLLWRALVHFAVEYRTTTWSGQANPPCKSSPAAECGPEENVRAADSFNGSFITKHNRGGRRLGVYLFHSVYALQEYVSSDRFEPSIDGITLIQDYIEAPQPYVTRAEFVGGRFLYAVRVDTSEGFELCPADVCQVGSVADSPAHPKFSIIDDFSHPIIDRYERFLQANDIHIAGIEFIVSKSGELLTYDVNTNTN